MTTIYAGVIAFAFLASYGALVAICNAVKHRRARMAARCFLTGE
jgi:hypothetical protein